MDLRTILEAQIWSDELDEKQTLIWGLSNLHYNHIPVCRYWFCLARLFGGGHGLQQLKS
jgi:hypothetical protein